MKRPRALRKFSVSDLPFSCLLYPKTRRHGDKPGRTVKIDPYKILGINKNSPVEVVKKAYREFAKKNHPDICPSDRVKEDIFKQITAVYHKLVHIEYNTGEIKRIRAHSEEFRTALDVEHQCVKEYEKVMEMVYGQYIGNRNSIYGDVRLPRKIELYA